MAELSQRTVAFLVRNDQVLLGYKKTGFGKGNYLGIGGKIETGESEVIAAAREIEEEIDVKVEATQLEKVADLSFVFPTKPDWSQQVHVFLCKEWTGEPKESSEIKPEWLTPNNIPFSKMWDDAQFWLLAVLSGHKLKGVFTFNDDLKVVKYELIESTFD
jgi:8-oxo-dGTP pyrophosphatase MutT (NUDIX family)